MALRRAVVRWLLDPESDPSVRLRVLTQLLHRPRGDAAVAAARAQIGKVGWAARILGEMLPTGQWVNRGTASHDLYIPKYLASNWRLIVLSDLGVRARDPRVRTALALYERRFFSGEDNVAGRGAETCITGNAARMLAQFEHFDDRHLWACIDWLVAHQKPDGGWHCWPSRTGTLECWEALAAFAALPSDRRSAAVRRSIERGAEFYLRRGLLREGPRPYPPWRRLHYPVHYYYDLLVGLDVLTQLGYGDDRRLRAPLDRLESMRRPDGRWNLDAVHPDLGETDYTVEFPVYPFVLELPGRPSRWITTTALRVLDRAGRL